MHASTARAIVTGAACAAVLAWFAWQSATSPWTHGFSSYYTAARALLEAEFGPWVYDDAAFGARLRAVTGSDVQEIFVPNPPTMALLAVPVAPFEPRTARGVWLLLSLAVFVAAVAWLAAEALARGAPRVPAAVAVVLLGGGVLSNLRTAQAYLFFAAAAVLCLALQQRGRDFAAGIALGVVVAVKLTAVPWLALIVAARRWRVVAGAIAAVGALGGLVVAISGVDVWRAFPGALVAFVNRPASMVTNYQTIHGFIRHLCVADATWNPSPAASCAGLVPGVPMALVGLASIATVLAARGARTDVVAAAGLCLSVMAVPIAAEHAYVILAVPVFVLLTAANTVQRWAWTVAVALLVVPAGWTIHRFTEGWWALLGYPRLSAAALLWTAALAAMRREGRSRVVVRDARARVALGVALAALVTMPACRDAVEPPPQQEFVVWRPIGAWTGRGLVQTEAFIGQTGAFRVQWEAQDVAGAANGILRIHLHSSVSGRPLLTVLDREGPGRGETLVSEDPREFFLVIESTNLEWSVRVDEAVRARGPASSIL